MIAFEKVLNWLLKGR